MAASRKLAKYASLSAAYLVQLIALETGPNQRIGCGMFEHFGPQNRGNIFRRQGGTILVSTTVDHFAAFQCNFAA